MVSGVAVHLEDLPGTVEVVLHHRQVLAHLVARHRVSLAVVAVALERAHPFWAGGRCEMRGTYVCMYVHRRIVHKDTHTHGRRGARRGRVGVFMYMTQAVCDFLLRCLHVIAVPTSPSRSP